MRQKIREVIEPNTVHDKTTASSDTSQHENKNKLHVIFTLSINKALFRYIFFSVMTGFLTT